MEPKQLDPSILAALKREQRKLYIRRFLTNKMALFGFIITFSLAITALFAPLIAPYDPNEMFIIDRLTSPSVKYLMGTDNFGRDLLSRIIYGAQISMGVGVAVSGASGIFGLIIGLYASYYKRLDNFLMRICDALMAFPAVLLAIAITAALGAKTETIIIALTIVNTPVVARVVRSTSLVAKEQTYIEAMRAIGSPSWRIIWKHIVPNTLSPLIVQSTFVFAQAIILEASLSFLGAGVPPPFSSWGNIVQDGRNYIYSSWWMTLFPGIAIFLSVLGLNLFGDGLRDMLDPHTKSVVRKTFVSSS